MAFYFALFNVSNVDVCDQQLRQNEQFLKAGTCKSPALKTSLKRVARRRHSVALSRDVCSDYRLLPRPTVLLPSTNASVSHIARSNREEEWRRLSSPLTSHREFLSTERQRSSLRSVSPIIAATNIFHHNVDEKLNETRKPLYQDLSSISSVSKSYSSASSTCSSSTSSQKKNFTLPPQTNITTEQFKETRSVGSGFFRSKKENFKQLFRRNSAAASFARHKPEILGLTSERVQKSGLLRSPNPSAASSSNSGVLKKVQFMPSSMSTSLISSPVSKKQEERLKLKNANFRKIKKHERKLSADDISFLNLGNLKEWNVKAIILPPRNSRNRKDLIEIVPSPKLCHAEHYTNDVSYSKISPKEIRLPDRHKNQFVDNKQNCCAPASLRNLSTISQSYVRNSSIRRAKSSHATPSKKTTSKVEETLMERRERRRRHSAEGRRNSPPIITITTTNDEIVGDNKRSPAFKRRSVKFSSDTKKSQADTATSLLNCDKKSSEKSTIRRRSTSDHNGLTAIRDRRRVSDQTFDDPQKVKLLSEKEKHRWLIRRFKYLFSEDEIHSNKYCSKGELAKRHTSPPIRRHFSAMSHSATAVAAPEASKMSLGKLQNF